MKKANQQIDSKRILGRRLATELSAKDLEAIMGGDYPVYEGTSPAERSDYSVYEGTFFGQRW
jgi:hypothetical protein